MLTCGAGTCHKYPVLSSNYFSQSLPVVSRFLQFITVFPHLSFRYHSIVRATVCWSLLHSILLLFPHPFPLLCVVDVSYETPPFKLTRSNASSPDNSLSDKSFLMLSNHLRFGIPLLLFPGTSITINLLPTYSSFLLNTCPYPFKLLSTESNCA